jgi:hypothetical protein
MGLCERLAHDRRVFGAVLAVATCRDSLGFGDLLWTPLDFDAFRDRLIANRDPGVIFETANRVFVVEEHGGELRFYAGGWGAEVYDQPNELGVLRSAVDAIRYAESFLVAQFHPERIAVPRGILSSAYDWGRAEPSAAANPVGGRLSAATSSLVGPGQRSGAVGRRRAHRMEEPAAGCRRCGGRVVHKGRARLAAVGGLMLAGLGLGFLWPPLWAPAVVLGLTGAYLLVWASAGRGRWCRGCKRFDGV